MSLRGRLTLLHYPQTVNTDMWVMIITCDIKHGFKQVYKLSEAVL